MVLFVKITEVICTDSDMNGQTGFERLGTPLRSICRIKGAHPSSELEKPQMLKNIRTMNRGSDRVEVCAVMDRHYYGDEEGVFSDDIGMSSARQVLQIESARAMRSDHKTPSRRSS